MCDIKSYLNLSQLGIYLKNLHVSLKYVYKCINHDKTNKMTPATSICPVLSESLLCAQWVAKEHVDSEDSDQTGQMYRLIWVFARRTNHFVGFVMQWLISASRSLLIWTASSEFGTYRLCEQRRFRRACASAQSRQNLRCSLMQAVSQEEPSDRKPDPWPLWMAGHARLQFVMTECSKTQIRLTGLISDAPTVITLKSISVCFESSHAAFLNTSFFKIFLWFSKLSQL